MIVRVRVLMPLTANDKVCHPETREVKRDLRR